jgi:hypothetical protein
MTGFEFIFGLPKLLATVLYKNNREEKEQLPYG